MLSLQALRFGAAEILACAVLELFPNTRLVQPVGNQLGFHYDFVFNGPFNPGLLPLIEEKMNQITRETRPVVSTEMMRENAKEMFRHFQQPLKANALQVSSDVMVDVFQMGDFRDACPAPHIYTSRDVAAFALQGSSEITINLPSGKQKVTRIQGVVFHNQKVLKRFLRSFEEGKKIDHRRLSAQRQLLALHEEVGESLWCWQPKGAAVREQLVDLWKQEGRSQGYQPVFTPTIVSEAWLRKLGCDQDPHAHWDALPFSSIEGVDYVLASQPAALHALLFKSIEQNKRRLPVRFSEWKEHVVGGEALPAGGPLTSRTYTMDHQHSFCSMEQLPSELNSSLQFIVKMITLLQLNYRVYLKGRGRSSRGAAPYWERATGLLTKALTECNLESSSDGEDDASCGPRVEFCLIDAFGGEWAGPYVEIDVVVPERLGLNPPRANKESLSKESNVFIIQLLSRSVFGPLERLVALLVQRYEGVLPFWITPEQVRILPLGKQPLPYVGEVFTHLTGRGLRVTIDDRDETLAAKVHGAHTEGVPYTIVLGEKEQKEGSIPVRSADGKKVEKMSLQAFADRLVAKVSLE